MNCSKFTLEYESLVAILHVWWSLSFYFSLFVPYFVMIVYASYHTKLYKNVYYFTFKSLFNEPCYFLLFCYAERCLEEKARKFIFSELSSQLNRRAYNLVTNIKLKIISVPSFFTQHLNVIWWENFYFLMAKGNWNVVLNRVLDSYSPRELVLNIILCSFFPLNFITYPLFQQFLVP